MIAGKNFEFVIVVLVLFLINLVAFISAGSYENAVFIINYLALAYLSIKLVVFYQDYFNPISLILMIYLLRSFTPVILLLLGYVPETGIGKNDYWYLDSWKGGLNLLTLGVSAYLLGWFIPFSRKRLNLNLFKIDVSSQKVRKISIVFFLSGLAFLVYYFAVNFGSLNQSLEVASSGVLREGEVQLKGTSRFSFLSTNFLFWGSLILSLNIYARSGSRFKALIPPLIIFFLKAPFGGRVVAGTPIILSLLAFWYYDKNVKGIRRINTKKIIKFLLGGLLILFLASLISFVLYRFRGSGGGVESIKDVTTTNAFFDYMSMSIWYELGFISPFAYAFEFGQGICDASLPRMLFSSYTGYFAGVTDENKPGGFLTAEVVGIDMGWGIHTGAIIDYFIVYNLITCLVLMFLFGGLTKIIYRSFSLKSHFGSSSILIYVFLFNTIFWTHFESSVGFISTIFEGSIFLLLFLVPLRLAKG